MAVSVSARVALAGQHGAGVEVPAVQGHSCQVMIKYVDMMTAGDRRRRCGCRCSGRSSAPPPRSTSECARWGLRGIHSFLMFRSGESSVPHRGSPRSCRCCRPPPPPRCPHTSDPLRNARPPTTWGGYRGSFVSYFIPPAFIPLKTNAALSSREQGNKTS